MGLRLDDWQEEILRTKGNIVLCSGRQVGKSTIVAKKAAEFAATNQDKSVLIISATERQAEELFIKTLFYLQDNYKLLIKSGKERPTKRVIKLKNKSIIRCLPTGLSGTGIRGFTTSLLIADEAAFIPEEVWSAVTPQLLTTGGDIILLSTPHGKQGYFYERYNDPTFKTFHVNSEEVIRNRQISESWTLIQREKALEHLEREKSSMSAMQYAQEYLGNFVNKLRQFFSDELIKRCMTKKRRDYIWDAAGKKYYLGVDIARMGDDESTFEIIDGTDKTHLVHVENIITRKTLTTETENKIKELDRMYRFKEIYIDAGSGSLGVGIFDHLLQDPKLKDKVVAINNRQVSLDQYDKSKTKLLKEHLYNNILGLMERGELYLLDDDEIFQSFKSVQYEYVIARGSLTKLRIFGSYTHVVEGLTRACWCIKDKHLNIWVR